MAKVSPEQTLRRLFLTLFLRGRTSRGLRRQTAPQSVASKLSVTLLLYFGIGCVALFTVSSPVFRFSLYLHGTTMVLCGMFIAASAGETLFNKEEADILLHRPIMPAQLLRAKLLVLLQVSLWLAGAFNLAGTFGGLHSPGATWLFPFAHAISTVLEALFCTSCVVLGYEVCLRCFGRERLEGVITMVQIFVAIGAVLAGQLPRLFLGYMSLHGSSASYAWWVNLLPPAWFAGFDDAVGGSGDGGAWLLGVISIVLTGGAAWLALGRMARYYETGLQMLNEASAAPQAHGVRRRWVNALAHLPPLRWWLHDPVSRASFILTASYLLRDRDVKLRIYPAIAPMLVMPLIMFVPGGHRDSGFSGFATAFVGSYVGMVPLLALNLLQYSQQWQAADLFRVAPMPGPAPLCAGTRHAVTCILTVPVTLAFTVLVWCLHRQTSQLALLLPGLLMLPVYTLFPQLRGRAVPFSKASEEAKSTRRGLDFFVMIFLSFGLAALAGFAGDNGWLWQLLLVESVLVAIVYTLMCVSLASMRWPSIE